MGSILDLSFHLRKPYKEAKNLIDVFTQIINEGGRCEICLLDSYDVSGKGYVLLLKLYRCRNSFFSTSLGAKITDTFSKEDLLKITKFNFASTYYCPIKFSLKDSKDGKHGPIISISLFEHSDANVQNNINQHFKLIDITTTTE